MDTEKKVSMFMRRKNRPQAYLPSSYFLSNKKVYFKNSHDKLEKLKEPSALHLRHLGQDSFLMMDVDLKDIINGADQSGESATPARQTGNEHEHHKLKPKSYIFSDKTVKVPLTRIERIAYRVGRLKPYYLTGKVVFRRGKINLVEPSSRYLIRLVDRINHQLGKISRISSERLLEDMSKYFSKYR